MTGKTIYIVFGASGEYSSRREWAIAAYENEAEAEKHVVAAQQNAGEIRAAVEADDDETWDLAERLTKAAKFDPNMDDYDWSDVDYYIVAVDVFPAFDKYERPKP